MQYHWQITPGFLTAADPYLVRPPILPGWVCFVAPSEQAHTHTYCAIHPLPAIRGRDKLHTSSLSTHLHLQPGKGRKLSGMTQTSLSASAISSAWTMAIYPQDHLQSGNRSRYRSNATHCCADRLASSTRSSSRQPRQAGRHDHLQCGAH